MPAGDCTGNLVDEVLLVDEGANNAAGLQEDATLHDHGRDVVVAMTMRVMGSPVGLPGLLDFVAALALDAGVLAGADTMAVRIAGAVRIGARVLMGSCLVWSVDVSAADDRRAACMARNADVPARYLPIIQALCADHHNLGGVGASVAIAEGGVLRWVATAGQRCAGGPPVEVDTGFRIGSLTKLLTAALVATAVDAGAWDLDEAVVRAVPELGAGVDARMATISLRQLLGHTAGLPELWPREAPEGEAWLDMVGERALWTDPGALWSYSNVGYALVGAALERSSGMSYAGLLHERLLAPLGAVHITADPELAMRDGAACGHLGRGARVLPLDVHDDLELGAGGARWAAPAGGVVASSGALAQVVLGLFDPLGSPMSAVMQAELLRPQIATHERPGESHALGVRVQTLADGSLLYAHAGATGDFAAELYFVPARGFALVLLSNTGDALQATGALALQTLLGLSRALPGPPGPLMRYAGQFWVEGEAGPIVVAVGDGLTITSAARGLDEVVLESIGDHRFRARDRPGSLWTFVFAEGPTRASHLRGPALVGVARVRRAGRGRGARGRRRDPRSRAPRR